MTYKPLITSLHNKYYKDIANIANIMNQFHDDNVPLEMRHCTAFKTKVECFFSYTVE
jgi:hypothetical protein